MGVDASYGLQLVFDLELVFDVISGLISSKGYGTNGARGLVPSDVDSDVRAVVVVEGACREVGAEWLMREVGVRWLIFGVRFLSFFLGRL